MDRGKRIVLFVFVVCAVGGGWYMAYYGPLQRDIQHLEQEVAIRRGEIEKGWREAMAAPDLERRAGDVRAKLALRKATFPSLEALPDLMKHLVELSEPLGLRLTYGEPLEAVSEGMQNREGVATLPIRLHVEGPFLFVGRYLTTLADLPYFAGFGAFQCRRAEESLFVEATVEVYMYVLEAKDS